MSDVDPVIMTQAIEAWQHAGHGAKGAVLSQWLPILGISAATFHREKANWGRQQDRKPRYDRGRRRNPERVEWVREIIILKNRPPKGIRSICTEDAQRWAVRLGNVPEDALKMSSAYINYLAREMGWTQQARRENRFEAAYPNQVHQFDASGSEYFYPVKKLGDEWVLKLRRQKMKNKEQPKGLKVWAYGLADDYSGYRLSRYTVAAGEAAEGGIRFLQWAWAVDPEHAPFRGLPEILYLDNGVITKSHAFTDFVKTINVALQTHRPYQSQATGKVENNWRAMWNRFENQFFIDPGWESREITLTELNQELAGFWRSWNQRRHRRESLSREAIWPSIMHQGGPVDIDPAAWARIFRRDTRTLDAAGCFDWQGVTYQVKEIHATRVMVYQGLLDGGVLVEDLRDRQRYGAVEFAPKPWGTFIGQKKSELDKLVEADPREILAERPTIFPKDNDNVVHLVRSREVRESSFEMPEGMAGTEARPAGDSLEDLAAGVEVIQGSGDKSQGPVELYNTPLDRYIALKVRVAQGKRLTVEDVAFMRDFETEYASMLTLLGSGIDKRVSLAAVE
jgi:transposase InsO family protein